MRVRAKIRLMGRFDGASSCTVTISLNPNLISVRPHRRHRSYEMLLEDVAKGIIFDVVKAEKKLKLKNKR